MDLRNARVLVTGATGGIGAAIASALGARGATLTVSGRREDILGQVAARVGGRAVVADLAAPDGPEQLLEAAGEVDVVVANAALPASGLLSDYSIAEIDRALDVNLRAPIVMAKLAGAQMAARRSGHLVFISSLAGKNASGGASLYNGTKFGLRGFALGFREDMRIHGVGVSLVNPGFVREAGMFAEAQVTLPRGVGTCSPEEVGAATVKAIEKNVAETDVAPLGMRVASLFGLMAPGFSAAVQRRIGGDKISAALAEGQRDKR